MKKTCLVTGASGFIGQALCKSLTASGWAVTALLRASSQHIQGAWQHACIGDICAINDDWFAGIDVVFHLAGIAHQQAPVADYRSNHDLACKLATAAGKNGVRAFVFVSSTSAMSITDNMVGSEADGIVPDIAKNPYGYWKRQTEDWLLQHCGMEQVSILRPCLVYGVGVKGNLLQMIKGIDRHYFPPLPETGTVRSMVSVDDVARALQFIAVNPQANRNVYIATDSCGYSARQLYVAICHGLQQTVPKWTVPLPVLKLAGYLGDAITMLTGFRIINSDMVSKLTSSACYSSRKLRALGWESMDTLESVMPEMIRSYRNAS